MVQDAIGVVVPRTDLSALLPADSPEGQSKINNAILRVIAGIEAAPCKAGEMHTLNEASSCLFENCFALCDIPSAQFYVRQCLESQLAEQRFESFRSEFTRLSRYMRVESVEPAREAGERCVLVCTAPVFISSDGVPSTTVCLRVSTANPQLESTISTIRRGDFILVGALVSVDTSRFQRLFSAAFFDSVEVVKKPLNIAAFLSAESLPLLNAKVDSQLVASFFRCLGVLSERDVALAYDVFAQNDTLHRFARWPGAWRPDHRGSHHCRTGGLLSHSLQVARAALLAAGKQKQDFRSLLILGCLMHDVGKTRVYERAGYGWTYIGDRYASHEVHSVQLLIASEHYVQERHVQIVAALMACPGARGSELARLMRDADRLSASLDAEIVSQFAGGGHV